MAYRDLEPDWIEGPAMVLRSVSVLTPREEEDLRELERRRLTARVTFAVSGDVVIAVRSNYLARRADRMNELSLEPKMYRVGTRVREAYVSQIGSASLTTNGDETRIRIGRERLLEVTAACTAGDLLSVRCEGSDNKNREYEEFRKEKPFSVSFRFPALTPEAGEQPAWVPSSDLVYTAGARSEPLIDIPEELAAEAAGRFWWLADGKPVGCPSECLD